MQATLIDQLVSSRRCFNRFQELSIARETEIVRLQGQLTPLCSELDSTIGSMFPSLLSTLLYLPCPMADQAEGVSVELPDLSSTRLSQWKEAVHLTALHVNESRKLISLLREQIRTLWQELSWTEEESREHPIDRFVGLSGSEDALGFHYVEGEIRISMARTILLLEERRNELQLAFQRLHSTVKFLMPQICNLWRELKVSVSDSHRTSLWEALLGKKAGTPEERQEFLRTLLNDTPTNKRFSLSTIESVSWPIS